MVPEAGFEPARPFEQRLLRPSGLPIPSLGRAIDATGKQGTDVYPPERVTAVLALVDAGESYSEIARVSGVSRATIRDWAAGRTPSRPSLSACSVCGGLIDCIPPGPYAYLLGLYLGDGYVAKHRRGVYKLRITCCNAYPGLMSD